MSNKHYSAKQLENIIFNGTFIRQQQFYFSNQTKDEDRVVKEFYNYDGNIYSLIVKDCPSFYELGLAQEHLYKLQKLEEIGFVVPVTYVLNDQLLYMIDVNQLHSNSVLIDFGMGARNDRNRQINLEDRTFKFKPKHQTREISFPFESITNYASLAVQVPTLLAKFSKYFSFSDGWFDFVSLLLYENEEGISGDIYAIDVDFIDSAEKLDYSNHQVLINEMIEEKSPFYNLNIDLIRLFNPLDMKKMTKIFYESFNNN